MNNDLNMYIILIVVCAVVVGWVLFGLAFWISQDFKKINNTDDFISKETIIEPHNVNNDTISRQAAIDRATKEHDFFRGAVTVSDKARRDELLNVICWLGELPPTQPEHIKAKWLPIGIADAVGGESAMWGDEMAYHACDNCWQQALEKDGEEVLSDFCPHCGADMRGEDNETD